MDDDAVARELSALRAEVAQLRALQGGRAHALRPRRQHTGSGRTRLVIHDLETNPDTQYKVHRWGAVYWICNFPLIIWLFFFHQDIWLRVGVFITLVYSIYANLATDYGAMSSAMAVKGMQRPPELPLEG